MKQDMQRFSAESVRDQLCAVLVAWGMDHGRAEITAEIMVDADLAGIDSHGVSMLMLYERFRSEGVLDVSAAPAVVSRTPAMIVLDGGRGLGHSVSVEAVDHAVRLANEMGVGVAAVRRSHHFGAAGYYARRAAQQGLLALATTSTRTPVVAPTGADTAALGTNPLAFAAPRQGGPPFVLDMSTSVVAVNKVKARGFDGGLIPDGWVTDANGASVRDAARAFAELIELRGSLAPLGGRSTDTGGHKGYGLSMMVQILSSALTGSGYPAPGRANRDIGHFFLAIDPQLLEPAVDTAGLVEELVGVMKSTGDGVLVAGEPEEIQRRDRTARGLPLPTSLVEAVAGVCQRAGVTNVLTAV